MAKIRIYELARDLNMTNKALMEKLEEMEIPVSSHMGSLDSELADGIKARILGRKAGEVEETRIKPTIIRRRKRKLEEQEKGDELAPEAEGPAVTIEIAESPREEQKVVEETVDAEPPPAEEIPVSEHPVIQEEPLPSEPAVEVQKAEEPVLEAAPISLKKHEEVPEVITETAQEIKAEVKAVKLKKSKKKREKEAPAKIIRLPELVKAEEIIEAPVEQKEPEPKIDAAFDLKKTVPEIKVIDEEDAAEKDRKKKKAKKGTEEDFKDRKFFKKKISFLKKEVIEGSDLYAERPRSLKSKKAVLAKAAVHGLKPQITVPKAIKRRLKIDETIILSDLARRMGIKAGDLIRKLMSLGVMATVNQTVDFETASLVASEFNYEVEKAAFEEESIIKIEADDPEKEIPRPPVVTIMGHVDHGKTSLLDTIRKTHVTDGEAGGITQHIGAYHVSTEKGQIVFLDTPGHEAFTAMRARGAKITDLVVLVVAADDGVMPQTVEAINHAKAAEVPIVVAVNKIDKPGADPDRIKRQLGEIGLLPEEWGGETVFLQVSAKMNQGIDDLLEMILLQAEVLDLKANPDKHARGHVIEAKLDAGRGPIATVLIQEGTLHMGESVVCGIHHGKIRAMYDDRGILVGQATPSIPVEILGLSGVPMAGDEFMALEDDKVAKQVSVYRSQKQRSKDLAKTSRMSLEKLFEKMKQGEVKDLNLIIKADVHGSIEALRDSLVKLSNEEVNLMVIHSATGSIVESDVSLAAVSNAIIIGFNVRPTQKATELANEENVDIRYYDVIYNVIKDMKDAIIGMMASTFVERVLGHAEVRQVFHIPKIGNIAGCIVTDGKIERSQSVRLVRDGAVCHTGRISSLRRYKDDAKEVLSGYECGIGIENFNDIKVGDIVECFYLEEIKPEIE
ncbi:MAG: translation initiation factor IF-2 [Thermodesulfobacteriota bacterium]